MPSNQSLSVVYRAQAPKLEPGVDYCPVDNVSQGLLDAKKTP